MHRKVLRRIIQTVVFLILLSLPFFDLLRLDVLHGEIYLFQQVWSFSPGDMSTSKVLAARTGKESINFFVRGILPWLVFILSFPLWGSTVGRLFCGWLCPVSAMMEAWDFFYRHYARLKEALTKRGGGTDNDNKPGASKLELIQSLGVCLGLTIALLGTTVFFSTFFVPPGTVWSAVKGLSIPSYLIFIFIGIIILIIATVALAKRMLCSYVCLFGLVQMVFTMVSPLSLRIIFNRKKASTCVNCKHCETVCPMGLKPRSFKRVNSSCINCGECITACERQLGTENGLFFYKFGEKKFESSKPKE